MQDTVPARLIPTLRELVRELAVGNYAGLVADGRAGRLTAEELRQAVARYGRRLVELPDEAFDARFARAMPIEGETELWAVDIDLWTAEEGSSDLTLQTLVRLTPQGVSAHISDLHVM
jgi:hypothetical protein